LSNRRFLVASAVVLIGLILVVIAFSWASSLTPFTLTAQIWDVQQDEKHAIIASNQFTGVTSNGIPENTLQQMGTWIIGQIKVRYDLNTTSIQLHVHVPADLSKDKLLIQTNPKLPVQTYFSVVEANSKSRVPLDQEALSTLGRDFWLEANAPGYTTWSKHLNWSEDLDQDFILDPIPVSVGVEDFDGNSNSAAMWLTNYLSSYPRLEIKDPKTLEVLRGKIEKEKELLARNPMVQSSIRDSLGVDLVISGKYENVRS
jgi:hypothetical protein